MSEPEEEDPIEDEEEEEEPVTIDFTSDEGKLRMLVSDTTVGSFILTDEEVTAILDLSKGNIYLAAAIACRSIAASAAKSAMSYSLLAGEIKIEKDNLPKWWLQLAEKYEAMAALNDTEDYRVDWPLKINKSTGHDESDYYSTSDSNYFDMNFQDGDE
jgi:hypothetical protein